MIIDLNLIGLSVMSLVFFILARALDKFLIDIGEEPTIFSKKIF